MTNTTNYNLSKPALADTVGVSIPALSANMDIIDAQLAAIQNQTISENVSISGASLLAVAGTTTTVTLNQNKLPKAIKAIAMGDKRFSEGRYAQIGSQVCTSLNVSNGTYSSVSNYAIFLNDSVGNGYLGIIQNVVAGSFKIAWSKAGGGADGAYAVNFEVLYN